MLTGLKKIGNKSLLNEVQDQIIRYIIESELKVGELIPTEKEIEEQLGISRTAIRESLKGLETLGIIEAKSGVGRFLKEFNLSPLLLNLHLSIRTNIESFVEVAEVRVCLESNFISEAAKKLTSNDIEELRGLLKKFESKNLTEWDQEKLHAEFHCALYKRLGNDLLSNLIKIFSAIRLSIGSLEKERAQRGLDTHPADFLESHREIVEAIAGRNGRHIRNVMKQHLVGPYTLAKSLEREIGADRSKKAHNLSEMKLSERR